MSKTIAELLELPPHKEPYKSKTADIISCPDPGLLYGVELELENTHQEDWNTTAFYSTSDGSLRNDGWEYISRPMDYSNLVHSINYFYSRWGITSDNISERCSVHVHVNCHDITEEQLTSLCLLYQTFEGLLFNWAGPHRYDNVFCVPWSQTNITFNSANLIIARGIKDIPLWEKYTALNLTPLHTLGTVEFRHMPGTEDPERIFIWLRIIGSMFAYIKKHDYKSIRRKFVALNSNSAYKNILEDVFQMEAPTLMTPDYKTTLEQGVLDIKYMLINNLKKSK